MALTILIRPKCSSNFTAHATCFTKENYNTPSGHLNNTLSLNTSMGVLGGSVAAVSGVDYTSFPCNESAMPIGLYITDAAGEAFENIATIASNIVSVAFGAGIVEVDVYETHDDSNNLITYTEGDKLYSSDQGFLTNVVSTSGNVVGRLIKAPTTESPVMGVRL